MLQRHWRIEFDARNADFVIERAPDGFSLVLIHIASPCGLPRPPRVGCCNTMPGFEI
jgi:hypothetical protein